MKKCKNKESYEIIDPPFLNLKERSKEEIKFYFKWFINQIPLRIKILENLVNHCSEKIEYINWKADNSPESLLVLGEWFKGHASLRELNNDEKNLMYELQPKWVREHTNLPETTLSTPTISLTFDIGIYFSQVLQT